MVHRAAERLEVGAPPTAGTLTNQNIPKPRIKPSGNEAPELIMASQANISPSSGVDSLQAMSFVSSSSVDLPMRTIPPSTSLNSQPGATIPPGVKPISANSQTTSKPRKCGCKCDTDCDCICPCKNHCVCLPYTCSQGCNVNCQVKCDKKCGSASFWNLVVCLDGISNQFGHQVCHTLWLAVSCHC